jgi:protein kinase X
VLLFNACLLLFFISVWLSPETFGYTLVLTTADPAGSNNSDFLAAGTGTFGRVCLCREKPTKKYGAMKILAISDVIRLKQVEHVKNEKNILQEIRHPFIVNLWVHCQCLTKLSESHRLHWSQDEAAALRIFYLLLSWRSWDSSVNIVTALRAGREEFDSRWGQGFFFLSSRPDGL